MAAARECIGFIGVGIMGEPMAGHLLDAGYPVTITANRNRAPIEALCAKGAIEATSLRAAVENSDVIILCLPNSDVVARMMGEIEDHLRDGMMLIDCGTSRPQDSAALADRLSMRGVAFVESPVTGGRPQALEASNGALVGCAEADFIRAERILSVFCGSVVRYGAVGAGGTAKLINNYMVMGMAALVVESYQRARAADIDWAPFYEAMMRGAGRSGVLERIVGQAVEGNMKGYVFHVSDALKDVRYFTELSAHRFGAVSPLAQAVEDVFAKAVDEGQGRWMLSEMLLPEGQTPEGDFPQRD
jgi:3-hydroxyisobutyrate dehydrogenase-like beta-hydroxyacid dehydrogenase